MIDGYVFGKISINGEAYEKDVEVRWTGEVLDWKAQEGHVFSLSDIERAVAKAPELIIFGIGQDGLSKVSDEARNELLNRNIEYVVCKTREAVKDFNISVYGKKKVIGLFHLTD